MFLQVCEPVHLLSPAVHKVFSIEEVVYKICTFIPDFDSTWNLLTATDNIKFVNGRNIWFNLLLNRIESDWDVAWEISTYHLMDCFQVHKYDYWTNGRYSVETVRKDISTIIERIHAFNIESNRRITTLYNQMDPVIITKPVVVILHGRIAPRAVLCDQRVDICIHLVQQHNFLGRKHHEPSFAATCEKFFNTPIWCYIEQLKLYQQPIDPTNAHHILQLRRSCLYCNQQIIRERLGFTFRIGFNPKRFIELNLPEVIKKKPLWTMVNRGQRPGRWPLAKRAHNEVYQLLFTTEFTT